jgi:tetratricopeptide (TPR) repeat protein
LIDSNVASKQVFIGRNRELDELLQELATAIEGRGRVLLISGKVGSGRTTLINHFLSSLSERVSISTLTSQCIPNYKTPYYPFNEAFEKYSEAKKKSASEKENNEILKFLRFIKSSSKTDFSVEVSAQTRKNQVYTAAKNAILGICSKTPTILFMEDIQYADSASIELLQFISKLATSKQLLVILTSDESFLKENNAFSDYFNNPQQIKIFRNIMLSGLSFQEATSLAAKISGINIQTDQIRTLYHDSDCNPLFLIESLKAFRTNPEIFLTSNRPSLQEIIRIKADSLSSSQRKILNAASVFIKPFDATSLGILAKQSTDETIKNLQEISKLTNWIREERSVFSFINNSIRDVVYSELLEEEKKSINEAIAQELEKLTGNLSDQLIGDLAYYFCQSDKKEKAIQYSILLAEKALSLGANEEAIEQLRYIIDQTRNTPSLASQLERAQEALGDALLGKDNIEASKSFELVHEQSNDQLTKLRNLRKAAFTLSTLGCPNQALTLLAKPILSSVDELEYARLRLVKGMVESQAGYMPNALEDLESSLKVFEENKSSPDIIDCLNELALSYLNRPAPDRPEPGQYQKSLVSILRALKNSNQTGDIAKQFYSLTEAFILTSECNLEKQSSLILDQMAKSIQSIEDPKFKDSILPWYYWCKSYLIENQATNAVFAKIYDRMDFEQSPSIQINVQEKQSLLTALENSQNALLIIEKNSQASEIQSLLYGNIIRQYCFLGEISKAEAFVQKLEELVSQSTVAKYIATKSLSLYSLALFYLFKSRWEEANSYFKKSIENYSIPRPGTNIEANIYQWYCYALLQQRVFENALEELAKSKKIKKELEKRLNPANITAYLSAPSKVQVEQEFTFELEIINTGNAPIQFFEIKNLRLEKSAVLAMSPFTDSSTKFLDPNIKQIDPFTNISITATTKYSESGNYDIAPEILFEDSIGAKKTVNLTPIAISVQGVQSTQPPPSIQLKVEPTPPEYVDKPTSIPKSDSNHRPFDVFLCYRKSSGKDFADHLKPALEELGLHTFQDCSDIPRTVNSQEGWSRIRDKALQESKYFVVLMTPGFDLSAEVVKEIDMARKQTDKSFIFFRHRNMGRKIIVHFDKDSLDIGELEQVSFDSKEELLRHAVNILPCSKPS